MVPNSSGVQRPRVYQGQPLYNYKQYMALVKGQQVKRPSVVFLLSLPIALLVSPFVRTLLLPLRLSLASHVLPALSLSLRAHSTYR